MAVRHEGLKVRLDPNNTQRGYLAGCGGAARVAYNFAVEQLLAAQEEFTQARARGGVATELPRPLSAIDVQKRWHEEKHRRYPWHGQYPSKVYLFAIRQAVKAHRSWMAGTTGFPRFKARSPQASFSVCETLALGPRHLQLSKLGEVRIAGPDPRQAEVRRLLRRNRARIVSARIRRDSAGDWWASLTIERSLTWEPPGGQVADPRVVIGVDVGVRTLAVAATSQGTVIAATPPRQRHERHERRRRRLQRSVSRKDRAHGKATGSTRPRRSPSTRREKARIALARAQRRASRQRAGHLHALTKTLSGSGAVIVLEDLNVKGMMTKGGARKKGLNRRIAEASFGELRRQVAYKCGASRVLFCDRFFPSSKICSGCGVKHDALTLRDRTWTCATCGRVHDRDINAAINLAAWGEAQLDAIQDGDPDTPGPESRGDSARPQRGTPHPGGNPRVPEWTASRSTTAGTRQLAFMGAQDLDGPGQGPVSLRQHLHANRQ